MAVDFQGHSFSVGDIKIIGIPTPSIVYNQFDDLGMLVGLARLPNESAIDFKYRLLDVYSNRANSTYTGLVNGITRELGLSITTPISAYLISGNNAVLKFKGPFIEVWSDYPNTMELEINRYDVDGVAYTIGELIDYINSNSSVIALTINNASQLNDRSMTILNQTNVKEIFSEVIPQSTRFTLTYPGQRSGLILFDTVFFNEGTVFKTLVSNISDVDDHGKYYINQQIGDVVTFDTPLPGTIIRYSFLEASCDLRASPIIINSLQDSNLQRLMFEQVTATNGTISNGVPTPFGAELINELMSVFGLYEAE